MAKLEFSQRRTNRPHILEHALKRTVCQKYGWNSMFHKFLRIMNSVYWHSYSFILYIFSGFCKCGYAVGAFDEGRHSEPRSAAVPEGAAWQSNDYFTREEPSNAFGKLRFTNTSKNTAIYVRVAFPTDGTDKQKLEALEKVSCWMVNQRDLPKPNLIISVTGATKNFVMSNSQQKRFKRGIVHTAIKTGIKCGCVAAVWYLKH